MTIRWKKGFVPDVIFRKVNTSRLVSPEGNISFSGLELHVHAAVIASMLEFPEVADKFSKSNMIWDAMFRVKSIINSKNFLDAINDALDAKLSTSWKSYALMTSLSTQWNDARSSIKVLDATVEFFPRGIPRSFKTGRLLAEEHSIPIPETPSGYVPVRVKVREKSPQSAGMHAIRHVDLLRGLLCLRVNPALQCQIR